MRLSDELTLGLHAVAKMRGIPASTVLHQYIVEQIRLEKERDAEGFWKAFYEVKEERLTKTPQARQTPRNPLSLHREGLPDLAKIERDLARFEREGLHKEAEMTRNLIHHLTQENEKAAQKGHKNHAGTSHTEGETESDTELPRRLRNGVQ